MPFFPKAAERASAIRAKSGWQSLNRSLKERRIYTRSMPNTVKTPILLTRRSKGTPSARRICKAKINSEQDIRNAEKLKELLDTKDKLERAKEELRLTNGGVIDDLYVGKVKMCLAKLDTAAEKLKDKTDEMQRLSVGIADAEDKGGREKIESLEKEIADLDKKKTETENNISANKKAAEALRATESDVKRKKSGINVVFITVAGFALFAALLLFAFKMQSVALILAAVSAVSALLSFILRPADKRALEDYESRLKAFEAEAERLNADKTDVLQQLSLLSARLEAVNTSLGMETAALENQKKLLLESRKAMEEAENTYKAAEKTLLKLVMQAISPHKARMKFGTSLIRLQRKLTGR